MSLKFNPKTHRYYLDGKPAKSVTGLIKSLDKPALPYWAARTVAEHVADHLDDLPTWAKQGRDSLIASLKQVPWSSRDKAGVRGTEIHDLAEKIVNGEEAEVPGHLLGLVNGLVELLEAFDVKPLVTESSVANREHGYAGRFDFIGSLVTPEYGEATWLLDWKSSKGVYGDTALQAAAYAEAEFYVDDDDPDTEIALPNVDHIGVVHVTEYGSYLYDLGNIETAFEEFLHCAALTKSVDRRKNLIGEPLTATNLEKTA